MIYSIVSIGFFLIIIQMIIGMAVFFLIKRTPWKKYIRIILLSTISASILIIIPSIIYYIYTGPNISEGKIGVHFKSGVSLSEINETIEKYNYSLDSYGYDFDQDSFFATINVPSGEEYRAVKNFNNEEIVEDAYVFPIGLVTM